MTYPQIFCVETFPQLDSAEVYLVKGNGNSPSSVVSGVGTSMDVEVQATAGLGSSNDVLPICGSGSVSPAEQLNVRRDFWPTANTDLFAFVAEDGAPVAACEELFAQMPQPTDAIKRIFTFMSRVVICEPGHPLHGEEGYVYRFYCIDVLKTEESWYVPEHCLKSVNEGPIIRELLSLMRISFCLPNAPELPTQLTERAQRLLLALNAELATDVLLETLKLVDYHVCCMDSDLRRENGSCTYVMHPVHGLLIKVLTTPLNIQGLWATYATEPPKRT